MNPDFRKVLIANIRRLPSSPVDYAIETGVGVAFLRSRARAEAPAEAGLDPEEEARLKAILDQDNPRGR